MEILGWVRENLTQISNQVKQSLEKGEAPEKICIDKKMLIVYL